MHQKSNKNKFIQTSETCSEIQLDFFKKIFFSNKKIENELRPINQ